MPEGITSMTRTDLKLKHWEELGRSNRVQPRDETPYYILTLDGEIIYEGTRSGCRQRYDLTAKQLKGIFDRSGKFPDGASFTEAYQSERPMRKKKRIYYVYEGETLVMHGQHKDIVDEFGLGQGQLHPKTKTICKKQYEVYSREEWIDA